MSNNHHGIFKNLALRLLNKREKRVIREKSTQNSSNTKKVIIACNFQENKELNKLNPLFSWLKQQHISYHLVLFYPNKKGPGEISQEHNQITVLTRKDCNFMGIPKKEIQKEFFKISADILIQYDTEPNFSLEYLIRLSGIKFKIGRGNNTKHLDLIIGTFKDDKDYQEQIIHWLEIIKTK